MKFAFVITLTLSIILSSGCISTSEVQPSENDAFPVVTGTNLHGDEKTLPDCLEKDKTILLVAFERWQQDLCDVWYEQIEKHMKSNENTAYFEVPTISKMNGFMRWFIYRGMRSGIKDPLMRRQVITLHIDKKIFKEALKIDTETTVHLYVVDKEGNILARESGEFDQTKWAKLESVLKENN